jgi:16S rRNA processing protein RimM
MIFLRIGKIVDNHGINGEIKVLPITDNPELFNNMDLFMLSKNGEIVKSVRLEYLTELNQYLLCKLHSVDSIEEAKKIKGLDIVIPENMLPKAEQNEVYWKDIKGSEVLDKSENIIGTLEDYIETGGTDIFKIKDSSGNEYMISNNPVHVLKIDEKEKKIIINKDGLVPDDF